MGPSEDVMLSTSCSVEQGGRQGGRAAVTARVYPWEATSDRIGLYNAGKDAAGGAAKVDAQAWRLGSANATREEVLSLARLV